MSEQVHSEMPGNNGDRYATHNDFLKIFNEDMNGLYLLSFLLTGDQQKAEKCFVTGIEECAGENRVFMEWAGAWAKRVIVKNAIRELYPRESHPNSSAFPTVLSHNQQSSGLNGDFSLDAVLRLPDFERFVFVLCVLEHYTTYECALLLDCVASQVRDARTRAIAELASLRPMGIAS